MQQPANTSLWFVSLSSLKLCVILEPMQELMSRHKTYSLSPRDCLKTCLFQKWQRMVAPPGKTYTFEISSYIYGTAALIFIKLLSIH